MGELFLFSLHVNRLFQQIVKLSSALSQYLLIGFREGLRRFRCLLVFRRFVIGFLFFFFTSRIVTCFAHSISTYI